MIQMQVVRAIETGRQVFFDYHNLLQDLGAKPFGNWISWCLLSYSDWLRITTACENLENLKGLFGWSFVI